MSFPPRRKRPDQDLSLILPAGAMLMLLCLAVILWGSLFSSAPAGEPEPTLDVPTVRPVTATPHPYSSDWRLILVNTGSPLPTGYAPPELTEIRSEMSVDSRIAADLTSMLDAARAEGLDPLICAAFRSHERQQELFDAKIQSFLNQGMAQEAAEAEAAQWVAPPDTSEHQTGLAVDIVSTDYQILDKQQAETPLQQWLMDHCAEYGFILRYPPEKSDLTGIVFEPWHYRYVGREAAREITDQGLCLEEYWAG